MPDVSTVKLNGVTLMTVNDTTATVNDVAENKDFYAASGTKSRGVVPISSFAFKDQLAPIEVSPAESAHSVSDFIVYGDDLCIVTSPIAVNDSLVEDVNYKVVAVGGKLTDLAASLAPIQEDNAPAADDYSVDDLMVVNGKLYYTPTSLDEGMDYVVTDGDQYDPTNVFPTTIADRINSVRDILQTQINDKANKNSPSFTGSPSAPTPSSGDNDTSIATTAFVQGEVNPLRGAMATIETSSTASRAYAVGEYLWKSGELLRVTVAIASGGTITKGTNCVATTVGDELSHPVTYTDMSGGALSDLTGTAVKVGNLVLFGFKATTTSDIVAGEILRVNGGTPAVSGQIIKVYEGYTDIGGRINAQGTNTYGRLYSNGALASGKNISISGMYFT